MIVKCNQDDRSGEFIQKYKSHIGVSESEKGLVCGTEQLNSYGWLHFFTGTLVSVGVGTKQDSGKRADHRMVCRNALIIQEGQNDPIDVGGA